MRLQSTYTLWGATILNHDILIGEFKIAVFEFSSQ